MLKTGLSLFLLATQALSAVTVYTSAVGTAVLAQYTVASNDQTVLQPPAPPQGMARDIPVQIYDGGMDGMSAPVPAGFFGFSIELSVATTLLGENSTHLRPEFLNYLGVLQARSGVVIIRVGGNSQDRAHINPEGNPSGRTVDKYKLPNAGPTDTPEVHFTPELLHCMAEIGKLVPVKWMFGIPFLRTNSEGNAGVVVQEAMKWLGNDLLGLQLSNEPDLYERHNKKPAPYGIPEFFAETTQMIGSLPITQQNLIGPSVCCQWPIDDVLNAGYMSQFDAQLKMIAVMHYPNHNCERMTGAPLKDPQALFPAYLSHDEVKNLASPYFPAAVRAQQANKPFLMLETNTASCGGFPGISDAFAASLWGVDYALQMAHGNFSYGLVHCGGQNVYYNPFTAPPTNQTHLRQWSTGTIFYAHIFAAEAIGKTGQARVIDLQLDNNNSNRAGYAIYENGRPMRAAFVNYVQDPGNGDYIANLAIGGVSGLPGLTPPTVRVKYLRAPSVSEKYNITWAGQTMGGQFQSDGRLHGESEIVTITCNTATNICPIPVYAPSAALVFLNDDALTTPAQDNALTFGTSIDTLRYLSIDYESVKLSNGRNGADPLGGTSFGSVSGAVRGVYGEGVRWGIVSAMLGVVVGALLWRVR